MRELSNEPRSNCDNQISGEAGGFGNAVTDKNEYKALITKANALDIKKLFHIYNVKIDPYSKKAICPFVFHKNGRESTASFQYYPATNTFYCHGCKSGNYCVNFVSLYENISRLDAAKKIFELFKSDSFDEIQYYNEGANPSEKLEIMLKLSNVVREFIKEHSGNKEDLIFIENLCMAYDNLNIKLSLGNNNLALSELTDKILSIINNHK